MSGQTVNSRQYITFFLGEEEYGIDILSVQELRGWRPVTRMPDLPDHVLGVLNLRGEMIPILNLRARFGMESIENGPTTVVIVVRVGDEGSDDSRPMGLVVDAVSETHTISEDEIKTAPQAGTAAKQAHIEGVYALEDKMIILLDVYSLLKDEEV